MLKNIKPQTEADLHTIIANDIDALEEGMRVLKHEFNLQCGTADFLCVDSGGRIVVIEIKLITDDNILFQALIYYNEINRIRHRISDTYTDFNVDMNQHPRIILIAESFSENLLQLISHIKPDVELYEYKVHQLSDLQRALCYRQVTLPQAEDMADEIEVDIAPTFEDLQNYITDLGLRTLYGKVSDNIIAIGEGIERYQTTGYVAYKYLGKNIAWLVPKRSSFLFHSAVFSNGTRLQTQFVRVTDSNVDKNAEYLNMLENIRRAFGDISSNRK